MKRRWQWCWRHFIVWATGPVRSRGSDTTVSRFARNWEPVLPLRSRTSPTRSNARPLSQPARPEAQCPVSRQTSRAASPSGWRCWRSGMPPGRVGAQRYSSWLTLAWARRAWPMSSAAGPVAAARRCSAPMVTSRRAAPPSARSPRPLPPPSTPRVPAPRRRSGWPRWRGWCRSFAGGSRAFRNRPQPPPASGPGSSRVRHRC